MHQLLLLEGRQRVPGRRLDGQEERPWLPQVDRVEVDTERSGAGGLDVGGVAADDTQLGVSGALEVEARQGAGRGREVGYGVDQDGADKA